MSENLKNRFIKTMEEITNQVKKVTEIVNQDKVIELILLIIDLHKNDNRVFVYGAGRSGFVGRCFAQRLMHLGVKSTFISDAVTPQYTKNDLLILVSGSGETTSPVALTQKAKTIGGKLALFTANPDSTIGKLSDIIIRIEGKSKDVAITKASLAPYTSLFDISTLSVLDSIGGTIMNHLGVTEADIDKRHATVE